MAILGKANITLTAINDACSVLMSPSSCVIHADVEGSNIELGNAYTNINVVRGEVKIAISSENITISRISNQNIQYEWETIDAYTQKLKITGIPNDVSLGEIEINVSIGSFSVAVTFQFTVVRNAAMLDWILDWDTGKTNIGGEYILTPKFYAGSVELNEETGIKEISGVYVGPDQTNGPGLYGYNKNKEVFHINQNGALIGGWTIEENGIVSQDGNLKIKSDGTIAAYDSDGEILYGLSSLGEATFAKGKVIFKADGSASFEGKVIALEGEIAGWNINQKAIYVGENLVNEHRTFAGENELVLGSKGLRGKSWYIDSDGAFSFVDGKFAYSGGKLTLSGWTLESDKLLNKYAALLATESYNGLYISQTDLTEKASSSLRNIISEGTGIYMHSSATGVEMAGYIGKSLVFRLGGDGNKIAGWNFDNSSLWVGNNAIDNNKAAESSMVIGVDGIFAHSWYLSKSGAGSFANENFKWNDAGDVELCGKLTIKAGSSGLASFSEWANVEKAINNKVSNDDLEEYVNSIIGDQLDGVIESHFGTEDPTIENLPAKDWITDELKEEHLNDTYTNTVSGDSWRWLKKTASDGNDLIYEWTPITDSVALEALEMARKAQDTADGKRRVFIDAPTPPYDKGDLWVQGKDKPLKCCKISRAKEDESYNINEDWDFADNSAALQEQYNALQKLIEGLQDQLDGVIESHFGSTDPNSETPPASNWEDDAAKEDHLNDTYTNTTNGKSWRWVKETNDDGSIIYKWVLIEDADLTNALNAISNLEKELGKKMRVFFGPDMPQPPYGIGDLWSNGTDAPLKICTTSKAKDDTPASNDWVNADNAQSYADNVKQILTEQFEGFVEEYEKVLTSIQNQVDGKAETYCQESDPSEGWEDDAKIDHKGDLWWNTESDSTYMWNGEEWIPQSIPYSMFDTFDGKSTVFTSRPTEYKKNDIWFLAEGEECGEYKVPGTILVAIQGSNNEEDNSNTPETGDATNGFNAAHWKKLDAYTSIEEVNGSYGYISDAIKHAIENAEGTFAGGLALAAMMMLGKYDTETKAMTSVTAGICGNFDSPEDVAFWAGGSFDEAKSTLMQYEENTLEWMPGEEELSGMASFVVTHGGTVYLNDAVLRGYVYAKGGYFKGKVEADEGYFKGKVEADEGYFKGRIEADEGYFKGKVEADEGYFKGRIEAIWGSLGPIHTGLDVATIQYNNSNGLTLETAIFESSGLGFRVVDPSDGSSIMCTFGARTHQTQSTTMSIDGTESVSTGMFRFKPGLNIEFSCESGAYQYIHGVYIDVTGNESIGDVYAIYCPNGMFGGLRPRTRETNLSDVYLDDLDHTVVLKCNTNVTIYLPTDPKRGQTYKLIQTQYYILTIDARGKTVVDINTGSRPDELSGRKSYTLTYCNDRWYLEY